MSVFQEMKWYLYYDGVWNLMAVTDLLRFCGSLTNPNTFLNANGSTFNLGTHHMSDTTTELCTSDHATNIRYLDSTSASIDGASAANISTADTTDCMKVEIIFDSIPSSVDNIKTFVHRSADDSSSSNFSYVKMFQKGDTAWSDANGLSDPLVMTAPSLDSTMVLYFATSLSPQVVGTLESDNLKIQLEYL